MDCLRARELFGDHLEGSLDPRLRPSLHEHLVSCSACAVLRAAYAEVVDALRTAPELAAPASLVERVILATRLLGPRAALKATSMPLGLRLAAALAALVVSGTALALRGDAARDEAARLKEKAQRFVVHALERGARTLEELRLLRVVLGTALEGRVDRVNERVEDYRRLLEKRRAAEAGAEPPKAGASPQGHNFPNSDPDHLVFQTERDETRGDRRRSS